MLTRGIKLLLIIVLLVQGSLLNAQEVAEIMDYRYPDEYVIGNVTVSGVRYLDPNAIIGLSGLKKNLRVLIPGEKITNAVEKLWSQGLFSDIRVSITEERNDTVTLDIFLSERPRISSVEYYGLKKNEITDIKDKVNLLGGSQVTDHILGNTTKLIKEHFVEKGFLDTEIRIVQKEDPDSPNSVLLNIHVDKNEKVKISEILFEGNKYYTTKRLRRIMKNTKQKNINIFKASKYVTDQFEEDKASLVAFYNEDGYRDFRIVGDSTYVSEEDRIVLVVKIDEGKQYFFGNIDWVGNSIYPKEILAQVLNINRGDIYNTAQLNKNLSEDPDVSVSNLYLDYGYLFSNITPVEKKINGDSVDLEIRIFEGEPAYLNDVIIKGNNRTNEHVVRRELTTRPGDLFSKSNIIRSARQIGVLGHFDPEKINPMPIQNPETGTVDLEYNLEEQANDQFEISGGWGAGMLVGTVGVRFNNFAMKNFFKGSEWRPYPSGDGQSLSIRAQSNGRVYQSYNLSFSEPWLGGKSPTTFTTSLYRSLMTNGSKKGDEGRQSMIIDGASIGLGKRLEWPDDYFSIYAELSYQRYNLNNYSQYRFLFENGVSNMLSATAKITRFSAGPNLIYPRGGSTFSFSLQATPPYSIGKDYTNASDEEKYNWIEFHKWVFKGDYYYELFGESKLVLNSKFAFGYLGHYNNTIGPSPFENFYVGGSGMTGYSFYGRDVIAMRGYEDGSLTPYAPNSTIPSGNVYSKLTFELRYPFTLNPQATIFGLVFLEAGNSWYEIRDYNPFKMHRSAGVGLRANLPMFGLLGIDYAYGFDALPGRDVAGHQFHFTMGQQF